MDDRFLTLILENVKKKQKKNQKNSNHPSSTCILFYSIPKVPSHRYLTVLFRWAVFNFYVSIYFNRLSKILDLKV